MYQTVWGLEKSPFAGHELRLFYEGSCHQEGLARLRFLRDHGRRLGLILGRPGTGKTMLQKVFADQCRREGNAVACVSLFGLSPRELYWQLAAQLAVPVRMEDDAVRMFRQVVDRLVENRVQDVPTVLLVDDVHQAGPDLRAQLVRLAQLDTDRFSIVLAADFEQTPRLGEHLLELVDLRIDLEPWDEPDTIGYLQLALVDAGCQRPLFDDESLAEIHRLSEGVPRRVIRLAEHALMVGSSDAPEIIDSGTIRTAYDSLTRHRRL